MSNGNSSDEAKWRARSRNERRDGESLLHRLNLAVAFSRMLARSINYIRVFLRTSLIADLAARKARCASRNRNDKARSTEIFLRLIITMEVHRRKVKDQKDANRNLFVHKCALHL